MTRTLSALLFALLLIATESRAAPVDHTFDLTLNHSGGASFAIPPSITGLEVTAPATLADGGPTYDGQSGETTNALHEGAADPGSPGSVIAVEILFGPTKSSPAGEGIVHRDIATRNVLVHTNEGTYEMGVLEPLAFMNDGPADLRGVGPVRWMAPESLRSRTHTPSPTEARTGSWEIAAFSYFDVSYPVPGPGAGVLVGFGVLCNAARRRRS